MNVRVNRVHRPVDVLGFGSRLGIWVQGCGLACAGCVSRDTWSADGGASMAVVDLVDLVAQAMRDGLDGLTITGGEPFEQPEALAALVGAVRRLRDGESPGFDLLCFTGLHGADVLREHPTIVDDLDCLVPEPFEARSSPGSRWRGSANQPLVPLSALGQARYGPSQTDDANGGMQVAVDDGTVWMIGIPRPGDMPRVAASLAERGIRLEDVSWRP